MPRLGSWDVDAVEVARADVSAEKGGRVDRDVLPMPGGPPPPPPPPPGPAIGPLGTGGGMFGAIPSQVEDETESLFDDVWRKLFDERVQGPLVSRRRPPRPARGEPEPTESGLVIVEKPIFIEGPAKIQTVYVSPATSVWCSSCGERQTDPPIHIEDLSDWVCWKCETPGALVRIQGEAPLVVRQPAPSKEEAPRELAWIGLGAVLGQAVGGPLGGALGALLGFLLSRPRPKPKR